MMGSGSATHNLRALVRGAGDDAEPEPWAKAFDDWLAETLEKGDEAALADYRTKAPYAREAHPTDEHFLPLHVAYRRGGRRARTDARSIAASRWGTCRWRPTPSTKHTSLRARGATAERPCALG